MAVGSLLRCAGYVLVECMEYMGLGAKGMHMCLFIFMIIYTYTYKYA
jgi:hypothetical protein